MSDDPSDLERVRLTRRLVLWQRRRGHRSATDDILCAYVAHRAGASAKRILDLGAGQGSIALMLANLHPDASLTAVEVQDVSFRLLVRNIAENGLTARITPLHADLRTVDLGEKRFDLITGSPPYVRPGEGVLPRDAQRAAARFELRGGIEEYCRAAARWLAESGRAVFLVNPANDRRTQRAVLEAGLALDERWQAHPHPGTAARFAIYVLRRSTTVEGTEKRDVLEQVVMIRDERGNWSAEMASIREALELPDTPR